MLYGREAECKELVALVGGPVGRAGVLLEGEPGIGKSALVGAAVDAAVVAGVRVLRTAGVEAERDLAFAGLHRLLHPARSGVDALPGAQRDAVRIALGQADGTANAHLVGLAALTLLAEEAPLLVVVEDAQWLDRASADVLAFVARRIESEPIALVVTARQDAPSPLRDAGLAVTTLRPLADEDAAELVDSVAPDLGVADRARVLVAAAGNPLALTELPSVVDDDPVLPLTERLRRAFSARAADLLAPTRAVLLVAALAEDGSLAGTLAAAAEVLGAAVEPEVLTPAVEAGLVDVGVDVIAFRHPLMRSAIPATAALGDLRRAHLALAATVDGQPDRRAWHRASATTGADEDVAVELERTADRARDRGGVAAAVAALEQAARLSGTP
ncbi:AAA family ATPase, partial [Actinosynnema sp. NPDC020468]|uniref:AAA family ATPase n=1 Tax=Actinosynnema sp. NPDC020468 TaxID=3154488 RepID=UPI0033D6F2E9